MFYYKVYIVFELVRLKAWYWVRNNWKEFIGFVFSIASVLASIFFKDYIKEQPVYLLIPLSIPILMLFSFLYLKTKEKEFFHIEFQNRKDKDDWIGEGIFEYDRIDRCYVITNAAFGCIFSRCLTWNNYLMSFSFKIIKECIGVIIRAENLSNYIMLQISELGINPHIKINGGWLVKKYSDLDVNLAFTNNLLRDKWYKCDIYCEKRGIKIKLFDNNKIVFDREWTLPPQNNYMMFDFEDKKMPFAIDLNFGTIGFRNWGNEKALIRSLLVQKI